MNKTRKERQENSTMLDERVSGGWHFAPISFVFAPEVQEQTEDMQEQTEDMQEQAEDMQEQAEDMRDIVFGVIKEEAKTGTGLFENCTEIEKEYEWMDDLLCVAPYNCKHSLTGYYEDLKRHNIAGKEGAFLKEDFTKLLFSALNICAVVIAENTERPNKTKNDIADAIKIFDGMPVWGLFFQILILQGVCYIFENIRLNKGDNGYDDAVSLYEWVFSFLAKKEIAFCYGFYGENDLKRLEPFCEYLCTTKVGKVVQAAITRQTTGEELALPEELDTEEGRKLLNKACEAGIVSVEDGRYVWKESKTLLAYFAILAGEHLDLQHKDKANNWKPFEKLFGKTRLRKALGDWKDRNPQKDFYPTGADKIDDFFAESLS